jgi:amino acid adenylation domain-containing protein/non-ribosomal peptide synthase protein (TIGR01720 family)
MTPEERQQLLFSWNDTHASYPPDTCIHHVFEEQARAYPLRVAVEFEGEALTYDELNEQVNRLAHHLRTLGVGPEVLVGICLQRSIQMVVGLLGILKSGGAYVPIEPSLPCDRLSFMLSDSGISVVISQTQFLEPLNARASSKPLTIVCLDRDSDLIETHPTTDPVRQETPANLAYLIYTSGSTGKPKGAIINHESVYNRLLWMQSAHPLNAEDRVLQKTPFSFDVSVWEFFWPLMFGARLVLARPGGEREPDYLIDVIQRCEISTLHFVPSMLQVFLGAEGVEKCLCVRRVFCSGEALSAELMNRFFKVFECELHNLYGPTEAAVDVCGWTCRPDPTLCTVPIGRPIANTQLYVLDANLEPLPIGVAGELHIGGVQVGRGYLNRPELTRERFIENPFGPGRLYKTGDRVRYLADGNLEFLGRLDDQIKIGGFRVEPAEIELVLLQHPAIREAAVVARLQPSGHQRLVAYITRCDQQADEHQLISDLRQLLRTRLPDLMVPGVIVVLERLPLSPHGKVDRRALPEPDLGLPADATTDQLPRSGPEKILAEIWSELLGVASIGRRANFFELGGDSISSLQAVNLARRRGIQISSRQIFEEKTLERVALRSSRHAIISTEDYTTGGAVPLTPIQHWFFENHTATPHHFNQSTLVELPRRTDEPTLRRALESLASRHDALRLRFERTSSGWAQHLTDSVADSVGLRGVNLAGLSHEDARNMVEVVNSELQTAIDLGAGPLLQAALLDQGTEKAQQVLLVIHHLATDWVSWRVLIPEILEVCQAGAHEALRLPPVTSSFRRWAEWLTEYSRHDSVLSELEYWQSVAGHSAHPLPTDFPRHSGSNTVARIDIVKVKMDKASTRALLRDVPSVYHTHINDMLLLALLRTLAPWMGSDLISLDLEGHGRESESLDLTRTVGWFTSLFPVVLKLGRNDLDEAIKSVKEQLRRVPHRGIGYGVLRYLNSSTKAKLESLPRPEVRFNYGGQFASTESRFQAGDCAPTEQLSHLLSVDGGVFGDELSFSWIYSASLYRRETIQYLANGFSAALLEIVSHCSQTQWGGYTPSDFPLTSLSQKQLDCLSGDGRNIEDIYPLGPVQAGMLFHSLLAPTSGVYYVQTTLRLRGAVDTMRLECALRRVMDRHTALRTGFSWQQLPQPLQVVYRTVQCAWQEMDWRELSPMDQRSALAELLDEGRRSSDQLSEPPLVRCSIIRLDEEEYHFVWQCHHILADGWSSSIVLEELFSLYDNPSLELPAPRAFRDYILWCSTQDPAAAARFWDERLAGFTAPTRFGQVARSAHVFDGHETHQRALPTGLSSRLVEFAQGQGLTMNTLIQGAYALLLGYYSGEDDVLFGVTVSGRPAELVGAEDIVGLLINTLPLRVSLPGDAQLIPWLQDLQIEGARMGEFAGSSLVDVQRSSQVPVGAPLFDSILVFENYPTARHRTGFSRSLEIGEVLTHERTHYPLTVVAEPGLELSLSLSYWPAVLDRSSVARMAEHLETLLESMIGNSQQTLAMVSPITLSERQQLLWGWSPASIFESSSSSLHESFERQVAREPDRVALVFANEELTYGEVNRRANQLARHMRSLGVQTGSNVGLFVPRTFELIIGILAILKTGAAYVPLEPDYPESKLSFMMEDAGTSLLLSHTRLKGRLPHTSAQVVWIDDMAADLAAHSGGDLCMPLDGNALAYVMFTSGSTGHPKGVEVSHFNVLRLFAATESLFSFDSHDTWTLFHSSSFDFSVWEMWGALLHGGRLVIVDHITSRSPDEFLELLVKERVSVLNQTPSAFLQLMSVEARARNPDLLNLRFVIFGGESLVATRLRPWFERDRSRPPRLINMYGITETTVHVTFREITNADTREPGGSIIGKPIQDLRVFLLDQQLRLVPIGVPGEVYVSGPGVARGYRNRHELTRERFVKREAIPALSELLDVSRLYRTGDMARFLPDGNLEFLGRCDDQIKVRGFRIEPGEIESVLCTHPLVRDGVVIAVADGAGQSRLVAYVVCHNESTRRDKLLVELRDSVRRALPDHMVPSVFHVLDQFPLTPNGKVDRAALPKIEGNGIIRTTNHVPPQSPTEQILCEVWAEVLGVRIVGRHDDFFDLGGHSLTATQVVSRLRDIFGVALPIRLLFEHPNLAALGGEIDDAVRVRGASPAHPQMLPVDRRGELPLSFSQQRLWFIDQFEGANPAYNISLAVRLRGALHVDAMEAALNQIVIRHEVLRTTFVDHEGVARQRIAPEQRLVLTVVDLEQQELEQRLREDNSAPFDLRTGPLFRASLYRVGEQEHVLLLGMHHIISDGWSLGVLWRELTALYPACVRGEPSPLAALSYQYADFAVWQRAWLQGEVLTAQLDYWKTQLAGAPALLNLPTDRPRPKVQKAKGGMVVCIIDAPLTDGLRRVSRDYGASLFMVCHSAFAVLLHRYTGQEEIVVGVPVAGRLHQATEELLGLFVNTLPLRINLARGQAFDAVLAKARQVALDAFAHQDVPFEMLVSSMKVERSASYTPLFQVMLSFDSLGATEQPIGDMSSHPMELLPGAVQYDLTLNMSVAGEAIRAGFEYNDDLFDANTIERMSEHFLLLLKGIVESPNCDIALLPMLTEQERRKLLFEWTSMETRYRPEHCIHEFFEAQVKRTPLEIAVTYQDESLTYSDLNERSNRLARLVLQAGFDPGRPIAILVGDGPGQVVALLAALKAGGVIVGLPPDVPAERLAQILEEVSPGCILTDDSQRARLSRATAQIYVMDRGGEDLPTDDQVCFSTPSGAVYVVYTSGSTGRPKGIVQSHSSFGQFISWFASQYSIMPGKRVAQWASIGYDGCYLEIFGTLCAGATLCMLPRLSKMDPEAVLAWLKRERISVLNVVPSFFQPMMACLEAELARGMAAPLPDLEYLLLDGEVLPVDLGRRWLKAFPETPKLFNQYGPTECVLATVFPVERVSPLQRSIPVGKAIEGRQILILDKCEQLSPIGVVGQICIRSRFLTSGYLDQPQLTTAAFVSNPLGDDPEDLIYRTGDLGRWLSDGNLEFFGRMDRQVKVRGIRLELTEIEEIISSHMEIASCAIDLHGPLNEPRLRAYLVMRGPVVLSELREFLQERLPSAAVPGDFIQIPSLPRAISGKVDYMALSEMKGIPLQCATESVGPRTLTESIVAEVWSAVLSIERASVHDNFFELGGHSLLATQVVARLRSRFGVDLMVRKLFEAPTVAMLAKELDTLLTAPGSRGDAAQISVVDRSGKLPLSFSQQRLWFIDQFEGANPAYNISLAVRLRGALHMAAMEGALNQIVSRHEVLRTTFVDHEGVARQRIAPEQRLVLTVVDLEQQELERRMHEDSSTPFDLRTGPLFRASLYRLGEQEHVLLLGMHHIISDGWSLGVLWRELAALYPACARGEPSPLAALSYQYADFAVWQRAWLQGEVLTAQLDYWKTQLAGAPALLNLPTDRPRPKVLTSKGGIEQFEVDGSVVSLLQNLSREQGVTLFMTCYSVFVALLARYTGNEDIVIGTPVANRYHHATDDLIGFFVNTLPLRIRLDNDPTFLEVLSRARQVVLDAFAHQDVPFEQLLLELKPERTLSYSPVFQVMLAFDNTGTKFESFSDLDATLIEVRDSAVQYDLTLSISQSNEALMMGFEYNSELFDAATISRMCGHLKKLTTAIVHDPSTRISALSILTDSERYVLLHSWSNEETTAPASLDVISQFEARVESNPQSVALSFQGDSLSYIELHQLMHRVAELLRNQGGGPGVHVGICLGRGLGGVILLLATLKIGAVYVPLDINNPTARLRKMLADADVGLLITEARLLDRFYEASAKVLVWEEGFSLVVEADRPVGRSSHLRDAYIIYTSGSSGHPKGVVVPTDSLATHIATVVEEYEITSADTILQFAPMSVDVSLEQIFSALTSGAALVIRGDEVWSVGDFLRNIVSHRISVIDIPPGYLHELIVDWVDRQTLLSELGLRLIIVGGEQVSASTVDLWQQLPPHHVRLINAYGPTEATISATVLTVTPDAMRHSPILPIGCPLRGRTAYILGQSGEPVPVGLSGELHLGGRLASEYWNRPELTEERFIQNPFGEGRLYKTGDLARWLPDGSIALLGRIDSQIKVRGHRVEIGEVEAAIQRHPAVKEVVVQVLDADQSADDLLARLSQFTSEDVSEMLEEVLSDGVTGRNRFTRKSAQVSVSLKIAEGFVNPPTPSQRNWIVRRSLDELVDDIIHMDGVSRRFVSGSQRVPISGDWQRSHAHFAPSELVVEGQQVMQDWERPLMKEMAEIATAAHGHVLEVGFGMGISATYIQERGVASHTIVECNEDVIRALMEWRKGYPQRDVRIVQGRWQEVVGRLGSFDSVVFDAYPMSEAEFTEHVIEQMTFAESFFQTAFGCLRPGGVFTYYTNEIDSFSRRHQRALLKYFDSITLKVIGPLHPPQTSHYWWADSMVAVCASRRKEGFT